MTNQKIVEELRRVAAAYQILEENRFKIIAYERAADSIEHLTSEVKDYWDDGKLSEIPAVGAAIAGHLDELFRSGRVKHWESVLAKLPASVFPLLSVPGVGPKKAFKLVSALKLSKPKSVISDLEKAAKSGRIAPIEGFGQKSEQDILEAISIYKRGQIKENRMELPVADAIAQEVVSYLKKHPAVERVDTLGSLRRQVATIGDIDLAAATTKPEDVVEHFVRFPHQRLVEKGPTGATLHLANGRQVDLRVQNLQAYGAMLQYFTGSKNHNIKLREYALSHGLSLSEHGIKDVKTGRMRSFQTEEEFYKALHLSWIPPELREDKGEIEASSTGKLPQLVTLQDIKGDLHIHTNYDLKSSHDLGADPLESYLDEAAQMGYGYIGLSDHNPKITDQSPKQIIDIMKRRKAYYEHVFSSWNKSAQTSAGERVHLFIMCEVDILPDGQLALPQEAFPFVDALIVSIHSSFTQERKKMTQRVIRALSSHPKVRIFGHPTARRINSREGIELDWAEVFSVCKTNQIALEINANPQRLDLPDVLVFDAVKEGVKLCVNSDAHAASQMDLMRYGVSVARRGWASTRDIVNTLEYNLFEKWLMK